MNLLLTALFRALLTAIAEQIPTFVAAWEKARARKAADPTLSADKQKIDDFVKEAANDK